MLDIREYRRATRCEHRNRLFRCRKPLEGQCQYCARGFCTRHGERFGEHEEVCQRDVCQAKKRDVEEHAVFRSAALERNADGACGHPECEGELHRRCQRCGVRYCVRHLRQHIVTAVQQGERGAEVLRLCVHCMERISIWERE